MSIPPLRASLVTTISSVRPACRSHNRTPQTLAARGQIVGPGNLLRDCGKRLVAFDCAIDMLADRRNRGDERAGRAADIASDLVAQAEHDPETLWPFL